MAKPCFSSFPSSFEQDSVRGNREKTAVIRIPTSITQKLPLRRYALVDLHWKHTRFNSLKRTRRSTRTRIKFAKSTNSNDRINEIYLLSRRTSTPLSCLRASSMLSLSRVEITVKTKDDYVCVYMYIYRWQREYVREKLGTFSDRRIFAADPVEGETWKLPSTLSFPSQRDVARRASECELRIRGTARQSVRLERRHREFRQSDCASLPAHPHCAWRFGNCADFSSQSYKTSLPRSAGTSNPLVRIFSNRFHPFSPSSFLLAEIWGSFEIASNRMPISR